MNIVFLDAKTIGDDIDLSGFEALGTVKKYPFSTSSWNNSAAWTMASSFHLPLPSLISSNNLFPATPSESCCMY